MRIFAEARRSTLPNPSSKRWLFMESVLERSTTREETSLYHEDPCHMEQIIKCNGSNEYKEGRIKCVRQAFLEKTQHHNK